MTREETAYADTLNLIGSDPLVEPRDHDLLATVEHERRVAEASVPRRVECGRCWGFVVPYEGPMDGEHYAELWDHQIAVHHVDPVEADRHVRSDWDHPVAAA